MRTGLFFTLLLLMAFRLPEGVELTTDFIRLRFDGTGNMISLTDKATGREFIPRGQPSPLLSLFKDSVYTYPASMTYNEAKKQITLKYKNGAVAVIAAASKGKYLRFELLSLAPRKGVQAVVWGPYPTTISQLIGETVGVVRDDEFAVGVQALKINTTEGIPDDGDNAGGGSFIDPLPGQTIPEALKNKIGQPVGADVNTDGDMPEFVRLYRGSLAVKKPYGSDLRLFSRDRRIPRTIGSGATLQEVQPVNADLVGSAIALFGCPAATVLDVIEQVETGEGLPHPMLDGVWIKRSPRMSEAYLMYEGKSIDNALQYAKEGNFRLVHIGDIFKSWGHFRLETGRFPNGAEDVRKYTTKAKEAGISVGVHTLTTFTGTGDPYVSPVPGDSMLKSGSSVLARDLGENDDVVYVKDTSWFRNMGLTRTIKIGKELIGYKGISNGALTGCIRGQFKTTKSPHKAGTVVDKLVNSGYSGFLPDINLQDVYARRLAEVCNETGVDLMDFDGFEALGYTGHGTYAENKFVDLWYRNLDRYRMTCGASTSHYYWHIYSFMNWGEPWYSALRKSQVNYRIENQRYFERNLMPGMLGWFKMEPTYRPEEIEWIQARSAAFNAGYLLRVDENIEKNGYKEALFEAVREWQKARNAKTFTAAQIAKFKDPTTEFHLVKKGEGSWELYPVKLITDLTHKYKMMQTGEPVTTRFKANNPYGAQPLKFYITAEAVEGNKTETVTGIRIIINDLPPIEIEGPVKAGDKFVCDGVSIYQCDAWWNNRKEIKVSGLPQWQTGENNITLKSEYSGEQGPVLKLDVKFSGLAEKVGK
ncbi:hypothetical protein GFS24_17785 [Chitinophaga sp. SYP-B3965]|uniref:hypothetical protein n=1 Tax=Chitinophaga sp. SYP-B3965 TaxID=2663120 RepID=UPI001299D444|nr:hypothetical protein [Chitinophaga sp. SYP-B3965]MRG46978.1 hypothetical protein [Chitinophaga sp. SYP-B3965]